MLRATGEFSGRMEMTIVAVDGRRCISIWIGMIISYGAIDRMSIQQKAQEQVPIASRILNPAVGGFIDGGAVVGDASP